MKYKYLLLPLAAVSATAGIAAAHVFWVLLLFLLYLLFIMIKQSSLLRLSSASFLLCLFLSLYGL